MSSRFKRRTLVLAGLIVTLMASPVLAQLNTQHVKGSVGVKAGSQAPPGGYYVAPLLYFYSTDDIRNQNGNQVPINASIDAALFGAGVSVVTKRTFLGGSYGLRSSSPAPTTACRRPRSTRTRALESAIRS